LESQIAELESEADALKTSVENHKARVIEAEANGKKRVEEVLKELAKKVSLVMDSKRYLTRTAHSVLGNRPIAFKIEAIQ